MAYSRSRYRHRHQDLLSASPSRENPKKRAPPPSLARSPPSTYLGSDPSIFATTASPPSLDENARISFLQPHHSTRLNHHYSFDSRSTAVVPPLQSQNCLPCRFLPSPGARRDRFSAPPFLLSLLVFLSFPSQHPPTYTAPSRRRFVTL